MLRALFVATVLLLAAPKGGDPALVGSWSLAGRPFVTFKADGTGTMEGDSFTWTASGKTITVKDADGETDQITYSIAEGQLTIVENGTPITLTKSGKFAKAAADSETKALKEPKEPAEEKAPKEAKAPKAAASGKAGGKDDLAKLLVSSAWCTFHYSQVSGTSSSERYVYSADGTVSKGRQAETYSSGYGGTVAGQSNSSDSGRWKTENNQLYLMSQETGGQWFGPVPLTVTKNSNGYPIITSNGVEYSTCR